MTTTSKEIQDKIVLAVSKKIQIMCGCGGRETR